MPKNSPGAAVNGKTGVKDGTGRLWAEAITDTAFRNRVWR